jgi:hypothetical protein
MARHRRTPAPTEAIFSARLLSVRSNIDEISRLFYSVGMKETLSIETERIDDIPHICSTWR